MFRNEEFGEFDFQQGNIDENRKFWYSKKEKNAVIWKQHLWER